MRGLLVGLVLFFAVAARASAGGPYMLVGTAEDAGKTSNYAAAKVAMDEARLAGLDAVRITETWKTGEKAVPADDLAELQNAVDAAQFSGLRVIISIYPYGSSVTPLTDTARSDFASFAADVATRFPLVHDFIVGNEPNLNRFWLPQFGPDGEDAAAQGYEALLAQTYDALKAVRPHATVYGGALAPRGVDKPGTKRDTHSPTAFIADLGAAYRASGRQVPIMDALTIHPYPENSSIGPDFPHPRSTPIGIADYGKLVGLLGAAFDGTAQRGSTLPILYDEFGIETQIPADKASLYTGKEPTTTHPVTEATQAQMYHQAMAMTFCQKTVMGLLIFHVRDETPLSAWQSGVYYADGTPKSSLPAVAAAAASVHRDAIASCPGLKLTPKVSLARGAVTSAGLPVTLTCDLDCSYTLRLDAHATLRGDAVGGTATKLLFHGKIAPGRHALTATATAKMNTGPPRTAKLSFTVGG